MTEDPRQPETISATVHVDLQKPVYGRFPASPIQLSCGTLAAGIREITEASGAVVKGIGPGEGDE